MRRLALWCFDKHRLVIVAWVAAIALIGAGAAGAGGGFVNNFSLPGTESQQALDLLRERFPPSSPVTPVGSSSARRKEDSTTLPRASVASVIDAVRGLPSVAAVVSPYDAEGQISQDGEIGFATLLFDAQAVDLDREEVKHVVEACAGAGDAAGCGVALGGRRSRSRSSREQSIGELIGVAVAIVVLVVVLGSLAAMTIPLIVAFCALGVAMTLVLGGLVGDRHRRLRADAGGDDRARRRDRLRAAGDEPLPDRARRRRGGARRDRRPRSTPPAAR